MAIEQLPLAGGQTQDQKRGYSDVRKKSNSE